MRGGSSAGWRLALALVLALGLLGGWLPAANVARAASIVVTTLADPTGAAGTCSLRDAITAANTDTATNGCPAGNGADTITFSPDLVGTIALATTLPTIASDLTITGPALGVTLSGRNAVRVLYIDTGTVAVANLTIANGRATDNGGTRGDVIGGGALVNAATVTFTGVTFINNSAPRRSFLDVDIAGGGVANMSGTVMIANSTFSGNATAGNGGALFTVYSPTTVTVTFVTNSTFVDNTAPQGGAIFGISTVITNTIVSGAGSSCDSTPGGGVGNLDSGSTCFFGAANSNAALALRLGALANNGGPTRTFLPGPGSVAIDRGDDTACANAPVGERDQRGIARPQGLRCDIGAVEVSPANPAPSVTSLGTSPGTIVAGAGGTFSLVVTGANFVSGFSTIVIDGTPVATTFDRDTQLSATVPAFARDQAGPHTVAVRTGPPGGGTSNTLTITVQHPAPTLTGITPTLAGLGTPGTPAGSDETGLLLTGTNFARGTTVNFGGTSLVPDSVTLTPTSLLVIVPAALLATARVVPVAVTNPSPGGGTSASLSFTVANAAPILGGSNPPPATAGQGDTPLTVTGTGFAPGSTIAVGGQTLATILNGTTLASATIPATLLRAAGSLAITVTVPGPGGGTAGGRTLVVNPAGAAQLAATAGSPQSAAVTTDYGVAFGVIVRDQYGNPVADGTVVTFTAPATGASGLFAGGATTATAATAAGVATAPTFMANGVAGAYTVLASAGGGAVPLSLTNTPGPVARFDLTAPAQATAGSPLGLTVAARDAQGNLIPTYAGTVRFASSDAQATLPADTTFPAGDGGTSAVAATLRTAGPQTITVVDTTTPSATGSVTIAVVAGPAATIAATGGGGQSAQVGAAFAAPLVATVRDAGGNPVAGVSVTFAAPAGGATATFGGAATATVVTAADGVATSPALTAAGAAGDYAVTATASGVADPAVFPLTNTATPIPPPTQASVSPGSLAFGGRQVGGPASDSQQATLRNTGGGALTVPDGGVTIGGANPGDFAVTFNTCVGVVPAGGSCVVGVRFAPTATGDRAATLQIADSAAGGPRTVALGGTGTPPPASPVPQSTVTASAVGGGGVTPAGAATYTTGSQATYAATAGAGQLFVGWTLDGEFIGHASPLTFTVGADRALVATFAPRPSFNDIPAGDPDHEAIARLAALGIVNPAGADGAGNFQPDRPVLRAEVATFVARLFGWQREFHRNPFPDQCAPDGGACVDDELWNNVAALADYGVVGGYTDAATCASAGTTAPCYLPRDTVSRLQVVSVVARAFTKTPASRPTGYWERLPAAPGQYANVPDAGARSDLATYRANAGPVPGQADDGTFPDPDGAASRRFVIQVLAQAYQAQFGTDRVP